MSVVVQKRCMNALVATYLSGHEDVCSSAFLCFFFFSSRRRHTRCSRDWSSDVCSSDLYRLPKLPPGALRAALVRGLDAGDREVGIFNHHGIDVLQDRKSTRLNSSHGYISYAVFCLKKKKQNRSSQEDGRREPG